MDLDIDDIKNTSCKTCGGKSIAIKTYANEFM